MKYQRNDEVQDMVGSEGRTSRGILGYLVGFIIFFFLLVGFFVLRQNKTNKNLVSGTSRGSTNKAFATITPMETKALGVSTSDVTETPTETQNLTDIIIEGSNYKFTPSKFTVKSGENVRLTFKNTEGFHDLTFEGLSLKTTQLNEGESESFEFIAPQNPGEYTYYCSVGNHRAMGMVGKMIVQ